MDKQEVETTGGASGAAESQPSSAANSELRRVVDVCSQPEPPAPLPLQSVVPAMQGADAYRRISLVALVGIGTAALGLYASWLGKANGLLGAASQASAWLNGLTRKDVWGYLLAVGPVVSTLLLTVALLVRHGLPDLWRSAKQSVVMGLLFGGCLIAIGFLNSSQLSHFSELPWLYFVPVVPPVLLGYQALVAWRQRPRSFGSFAIGVSAKAQQALEAECLWRRYKATYDDLYRVFGGVYRQDAPVKDRQEAEAARTRATGATAYDPTYFATNFGLPALLLLVVGFGVISLAIKPPANMVEPVSPILMECFRHGIRWGVAGAFVYVLIDFGSRLFRSDLTVGAAIWAIVTLVVGPTLAVVLAIAWRVKTESDLGADWQTSAALLFAGLAPRRVVSIVEGAALQLLKAQTPLASGGKIAPVTNLRGVTSEVAARLREENIDDVSALAYADPIRLVQGLPYDLRQVINWIDQAQLVTVLPKHSDTLLDRGVTGAIDLGWRWLNASLTLVEDSWRIEPRAPDEIPEDFIALANGNQADALIIYEAGAQLFYEAQVCLLWVMYNCFSTTGGMVEAATGESGTSTTATPEAPRNSSARLESPR